MLTCLVRCWVQDWTVLLEVLLNVRPLFLCLQGEVRHPIHRQLPVALASLNEDVCVQIPPLVLRKSCWALTALSAGKRGCWDTRYRRMCPGLDGSCPSSPSCPVTRNSWFSMEKPRQSETFHKQRMFLVTLSAVREQWWWQGEWKVGCGFNVITREVQSVASHNGKVMPCYHVSKKLNRREKALWGKSLRNEGPV